MSDRRHKRAKKARRFDRSFQPSAAGKGDGDRTSDIEAFRQNFDLIDWGRGPVRLEFPDPDCPGITLATAGRPLRFDFPVGKPSEQ